MNSATSLATMRQGEPGVERTYSAQKCTVLMPPLCPARRSCARRKVVFFAVSIGRLPRYSMIRSRRPASSHAAMRSNSVRRVGGEEAVGLLDERTVQADTFSAGWFERDVPGAVSDAGAPSANNRAPWNALSISATSRSTVEARASRLDVLVVADDADGELGSWYFPRNITHRGRCGRGIGAASRRSYTSARIRTKAASRIRIGVRVIFCTQHVDKLVV